MEESTINHKVKVFNTLTRQVELLVPRNDDQVDFFVCGPTVYDYSHIGHAKTYTQFDFIAKVLSQYYKVNYLLNITDIDDKIIVRAGEQNVDPISLARKFEGEFFKDMNWLGNTAVTQVARSHDYVGEVISQVERLQDKNAVYQLDDGWYFDLSVLPSQVGKLSGRKFTDTDTVSRVENVGKRNSGDFVVWKFAKPGEPSWDSRLGAGRPGWHIEDTAITEKIFGDQYDLHGGALDLVFPHHEAEIIQMETVSGKTSFVNYWVHTGLLQIGGKKMAKSVGNFITVRSLVDNWEPETVRFFFLSKHYRSPIDVTDTGFAEAKLTRDRVENFYRHLGDVEETGKVMEHVMTMEEKFNEALVNDFNTPEALSVLFTFINNVYLSDVTLYGNATKRFLNRVNGLFGSFVFNVAEVPVEIQHLIIERDKARQGKDWVTSDRLREEIKAAGFTVEDTPAGTQIS